MIMPNRDLHAQTQDAQKVTLEQLLKLKRCEKPDAAFWEQFDRELQQRTLQSLVRDPSLWRQLSDRFVHARPAIFSATACLLFGFLVLLDFYKPASVQSEFVSNPLPPPLPHQTISEQKQDEAMSLPPAPTLSQGASFASTGQARFVVDSLSHEQENGQYRKVMASEGLSFAVEGVRYVADPLSGGAAARVFASTPSLQHF